LATETEPAATVLSAPPPRPELDVGAERVLEDLLFPVAPERFFTEFWESRAFVVERGRPGYYGRLFTLADVDRVLHVARSCPDETVLLGPPRGVDKPRLRAAAAAVSSEHLYRSFCEGFSMRLGGVDRFWPPLAVLASALARRFGARISVELYLTPASTQGVVPHYDNRDVLVLQVHGAKRWHLGRPLYELPGIGLNHVSDRVPSPLIEDDSPLLAESVVLRPGDLLYLPRGFYHRPVALDETSLHLSFAVYPAGWSDFFSRAVEFVALEHLTLRKALPPGYTADAEVQSQMAATFAETLRAVAGRAPFQETLASMIGDREPADPYPPDGHLAALARLPAVGVETPLERLELPCEVEALDGKATIRFGRNAVGGPRALAPAFEFIRDRRRFRPADLPGAMSDESRLVLARRLVREGLLRLAAASHER
jgi:ribosomal protein L16 Arg81 hydroxylase